MTAIPTVLLYCDGKDCPDCDYCANPSEFHTTKKSARKWAKGEGWAYVRGKDYCPECKPVKRRSGSDTGSRE